MGIHTFLGTARTADKVAVAYGGATSNFDAAVFVPAIREIRARRAVRDGLVGGWLPVLRHVFPETADTWSELVMFAPDRIELENDRVAPVWYRVARIEDGSAGLGALRRLLLAGRPMTLALKPPRSTAT